MDVNECQISMLNNCDAASGATCNNLDGGFECICPEGLGGQERLIIIKKKKMI